MGLKRIFKLLLKYFNGDYDKLFAWLMTNNMALGNISPLMMIATGRTEKLGKFVNAAIKGHRP